MTTSIVFCGILSVHNCALLDLRLNHAMQNAFMTKLKLLHMCSACAMMAMGIRFLPKFPAC